MAVSAISANAGTMIPLIASGQPMSNQMVPIGDLLELAIKKTYGELMNLAELLPRKTDMERKIDIMKFANRNRQLYVRLLALVKWASSASKVEKCSQIVSFLDKQSALFTDTADILARLSRETLVTARLPSFQLLAAVEVMTLGTYSRLPSCIRDRLVPPHPIKNGDKRAALLRLNHIIQQRLIASEMPLQMRNIRIEYGRITFTVENEFMLTLTLMGDSATIPWRVLNVKILVEDKEINGVKDLVQPLQIYFLQNLIQSRLTDNPKPLVEAYNILHSFCLSLQLQVLHIQSVHLFYERLKDFIRIDEYIPGNRIVISYWKDHDEKTKSSLIIEIDSCESSKPLQIKHNPELNSKLFAKSMQANILSIEKLLFFTTHERSMIKLNNLKKLFEEKPFSLNCELVDLPAVLHVSFIQPCMRSEQLLISIDMLTGQFLAQVPQFEDCHLIADIETCLNKNISKLHSLILDLRVWITRERFKKTVECLPVAILDSLPFPPSYTHESHNIVGHKLYFQFSKHHDKCLMVVFDNDKSGLTNICIDYYLLYVASVSVGNKPTIGAICEQETPKHYMRILKVLHLDASCILHSFQADEAKAVSCPMKRKLVIAPYKQCSNKRRKSPGYYISELAHVINFCEEKLTFGCISVELHRRQIVHQIVMDANGNTHTIDITKFSACSWCPSDLTDKIQAKTFSCTIRLYGKSSKAWNVLIAFANPPVKGTSSKEQCNLRTVNSTYDFSSGSQLSIVKMVEELLLDWTAIARLYHLVETFAEDLKTTTLFNTSLIEVKCYTYKKLAIAYGPSKAYFVNIYYKSSEKRFQLSFGLASRALSNTNPHIIVSTQLQQEFNQHLSIIQLLYTLNFTLNPLLTIQSLKFIPLLGMINSRPTVPVLSFCVIPQSSAHVRLIYRNTYCLDIKMFPDHVVSVRDGSLSSFDQSKVVEDLQPIHGLRTFLSKFTDKNVQMRRLSYTEDDNLPSPTPMDSHDGFMFPGTQIKTSPAKALLGDSANRGSTIQHSNPHTPASPLTSVLSAHPNYVNSPGTFSLSSPPSHTGLPNQQQGPPSSQVAPSPQMLAPEQSPAALFNINSPMNPNLHAPSPSFLPTPSPSGPTSFSHTQSPASQFLSQNTPQGHDTGIGSPFNQPNIHNPQSNMSLSSPAPNMWPASPSVSRPSPRPIAPSLSPGAPNFAQTMQCQNQLQQAQQAQYSMATNIPAMQARMLPQKPWAAAVPIFLTHHGFELMCRPNTPNELTSSCTNLYITYSQLERFLGSTLMRRHLHKPVEEHFKVLQPMEPGSIVFTNDTMHFKIFLDNNTLQSIHLHVNSLSDNNLWNRDELDTLQQFFELKVSCAPYKPNAFLTFARLLTVPSRVLKDFIRIMKLDLFPDPSLKWSVHICLTIPPNGSGMTNPGMSACLIMKNKILFFIQFSRNPTPNQMMNEPHIITIPIIYDMYANTFQPGVGSPQNASHAHINNMLKRFEYNHNNECIIYPAIREIMGNLQLQA